MNIRTYSVTRQEGEFPFRCTITLNGKDFDSTGWTTEELAHAYGQAWVEDGDNPDLWDGPTGSVPEADDPAYDADLSDLFPDEEDDLIDLAEVACMVRRYRDETNLFDGE